MTKHGSGLLAGLAAAALLAGGVAEAAAQNTRMPSTLRYGSGYLDVPSASVLPHLAITGTWSGYWLDLNSVPTIGPNGLITGRSTPGRDSELSGDASVAIGLFNRLEVGASIQELESVGGAGDLYGFFGRLAILRPEAQGLGLAVGARYLTASGDGVQPGRIGNHDPSVTESYTDRPDGFDTELSPYAVASVMLRGFTGSYVPKHDWTLSVGWGDGLFRDGNNFDWYSSSYSDGWFLGAASHIELGSPNRILHLMGDYNGFDVNLGTQVDFGGFRLGAHVLGVNYRDQVSDYRSRKFGVLGSVALCPADGFLCRAELIEREEPMTVVERVVSPPDTVIVERTVAPPLPTGTPASMCLATGENVQVMVTAQGDTLVGPQRVSIRTLRPGVVFAGTYADGRDWFTGDQAITYERANFNKSGGEVRLDCANLARVGEHMGVPLFAESTANRPFQRLFVPVRPGVWQAYETGLQRTRGE
jgi:hypothetical protein